MKAFILYQFEFSDPFDAMDFQPAASHLTLLHKLTHFHSFAFTLTEAHVCAAELSAILFRSPSSTGAEDEDVLQPDLMQKFERQQEKRAKEKGGSEGSGSGSTKKSKRHQKQTKQSSPRKAKVMFSLLY